MARSSAQTVQSSSKNISKLPGKKPEPVKLGDKIDQLELLRSRMREYQSLIKEIEEQKNLLEADVIAELELLGIDKATGAKASVALTKPLVPTVKDWDKFHSYILRSKAFHLLERRAAVAAWREEVESRDGKAIPGVESFEKKVLNLRSL
jgi:hypothetical protein